MTIGLLLFALLFAMNSALQFLIVRFARVDGASLDIGFVIWRMQVVGCWNRCFGALYQVYGLDACLWVSALLIVFDTYRLSLRRKSQVLPRSLIATT